MGERKGVTEGIWGGGKGSQRVMGGLWGHTRCQNALGVLLGGTGGPSEDLWGPYGSRESSGYSGGGSMGQGSVGKSSMGHTVGLYGAG